MYKDHGNHGTYLTPAPYLKEERFRGINKVRTAYDFISISRFE